MRPYRDVSPHDFGYINGKIDMLAGLLRNDGEWRVMEYAQFAALD